MQDGKVRGSISQRLSNILILSDVFSKHSGCIYGTHINDFIHILVISYHRSARKFRCFFNLIMSSKLLNNKNKRKHYAKLKDYY